jgi:DNA polymerase III epsilon subunit-like protein
MPTKSKQTYISVDVETAGPNPGLYSLLSIGACLVFKPQEQFYIEIQPVNTESTNEALEISQFDLVELQVSGHSPVEAMSLFNQWVESVTPKESQAVFVAFNAPFDWMFVNDYFHRYLGHNPFGYKALDIKAFYMGLSRVSWENTGWESVANICLGNLPLTHHALQDAKDQAKVFRKLFEGARNN